jgi:hypothetical protein
MREDQAALKTIHHDLRSTNTSEAPIPQKHQDLRRPFLKEFNNETSSRIFPNRAKEMIHLHRLFVSL